MKSWDPKAYGRLRRQRWMKDLFLGRVTMCGKSSLSGRLNTPGHFWEQNQCGISVPNHSRSRLSHPSLTLFPSVFFSCCLACASQLSIRKNRLPHHFLHALASKGCTCQPLCLHLSPFPTLGTKHTYKHHFSQSPGGLSAAPVVYRHILNVVLQHLLHLWSCKN